VSTRHRTKQTLRQRLTHYGLTILLVLSSAALMMVTAGTAGAVGAYDNGDIATDALGFADPPQNYGADCWPFVRDMIYQASDHTQDITAAAGGSDYFAHLQNAGGKEITSYDDLSRGDVVQEGRYGGHTYIIVSRVSDSTFDVVDSNHNYDNVVHEYHRVVPLDSNDKAYRFGTVSSVRSGVDTPGIVRNVNGAWQWNLHNANAPGAAEIVFTYGVAATDYPIVGDWDGDGKTTVGVIRLDNGMWHWYLHNTNGPGAGEVNFIFGVASTDKPVVGDWDGNGTTTPGIVRNSGGMLQWHLRNSNSGGAVPNPFLYGHYGVDQPIVGDWGANGKTTVGIVRDVDSHWQWNLRTSNTPGVAEKVFSYGLSASDTPVAGDWNGSGSTTPGIVRNVNGAWQWNLRNHSSTGDGEIVFNYGIAATDIPLVGNWDGK
jgi:uncharacterized protein YegP (UPF0339 family)